MAKHVCCRCRNCSHKFVVDVLGVREHRRNSKQVSRIHCPEGQGADIRKGWE